MRASVWCRVALLAPVLLAPALLAAQSAGVASRLTTAAAPIARDSASLAASPAPTTDLTLAHRVALHGAPAGEAIGALDSTAHVSVIARDRGWVRVRAEAWVRESELIASDPSALSAVGAADLRAQPDRYRGQTLRWVVQKLAVATADPLRRDLAPDEPYLLARGPGRESSILYLALPPSLVEAARRVPPLASVVVLARVRVGRSEPSGVPILDVESLVPR